MTSLARVAGIGVLALSGPVFAQDGPNILQNPSFESGLDGTYGTFGNAFLNQEYAYSGLNSLKIFGCFCSDYNGNGAYSIYTTPVTAGEIYRVNAQALSASFDSFLGTGCWAGMKIEFTDASGGIISIAEQRIIQGSDPESVLDEWQEGDFVAQAPAGAVGLTAVPVFLQAGAGDAGSVFMDSLSVATTERDSANVAVNPGFDLGVDYSYQTSQVFNGWGEQYGNIFFDDAQFETGPFSAGMFGSFPDYDGDGNCDPGGVSGLNQLVPGISEGDTVTLSMLAYTPSFDSIVGTGNFVLQKIEFLGSDITLPLDSVAGVVIDGSGDYAADVWHGAEISATAPAGTEMIRIVAQIVQPDCEGGSIRIDNVVASTDGTPPAACTGDFNDDGTVNGADFGALLAVWGQCTGCPEDLNGDGFVNGADLGAFLAVWGDCPDTDPCEDVNCDDGDPCTTDSCVDGNCINEEIPGCGGKSNCGEVHPEPGCSDPVCESIVCDIDPICCTIGWDEFCVSLANSNCP
ncbi:MAG: hypothetical protein VX726_05985 [Planctomycetota bacterium]|nr:hypothetical protein [Planctomycetota bacterium]